MKSEEQVLAEVARIRSELAVTDNPRHEANLVSRVEALLWALDAPPLQCARCCTPLGDEPTVATTYDDEPVAPDTEADEVLLVHARCAKD